MKHHSTETVRFWDNEYEAPTEINGCPLNIALLEHGLCYSDEKPRKRQQVSYKHTQLSHNMEKRRAVYGNNPIIKLYKGVSYQFGPNLCSDNQLDFSIRMSTFPERLPELWREEYSREITKNSCFTSDDLHNYILNGQLNDLFKPLEHQSGSWPKFMSALSERIMLLLLEEAVGKVSRQDENQIILLKNPRVTLIDDPDICDKYTKSEIDALILFWRPTNFVRTLKIMKALTKEIDIWYREELTRS